MITSINEFKNSISESNTQYYIDKGYIVDESIKNIEELKERIEANINNAYKLFAEQFNLPGDNPEIHIQNRNNNYYYISLESNINLDEVGIFKNVLSKCYLQFFSGRKIEFAFDEESNTFLFNPNIWSTLTISYEAINGGSNGMNYIIDNNSNSLYYNIIEGKFYTEKDFFNK